MSRWGDKDNGTNFTLVWNRFLLSFCKNFGFRLDLCLYPYVWIYRRYISLGCAGGIQAVAIRKGNFKRDDGWQVYPKTMGSHFDGTNWVNCFGLDSIGSDVFGTLPNCVRIDCTCPGHWMAFCVETYFKQKEGIKQCMKGLSTISSVPAIVPEVHGYCLEWQKNQVSNNLRFPNHIFYDISPDFDFTDWYSY